VPKIIFLPFFENLDHASRSPIPICRNILKMAFWLLFLLLKSHLQAEREDSLEKIWLE